MQRIVVKHRIPGTGAPASGTGPTQVTAGELAISISAVGATGIANLFIGDGNFVHDLVSAARQVEINGAQTINGAKTIGPTGSLTAPIAALHITGGATGQALYATNNTGGLGWREFPVADIANFDPSETYAIGDFVLHGGNLYRAHGANGPAAWSATHWTQVALLSDIDLTGFSTTETYVVGDFVFHGGNLYRAHVGNGPGAFNAANWTRIATLADLADYLPLTGGTLTGGLTGTTAAFANGLEVGSPTGPAVSVGSVDVSGNYYINGVPITQGIPAFSATGTYVVGDFVLHGGQLWRAHTGNGPAAWSVANWDQIALTSDFDDYLPLTGGTLTGGVTGTTAAFASIEVGSPTGPAVGVAGSIDIAGNYFINGEPLITGIPGFSATETYAVGEFVMHGGHLYRATAAVAAGAFNPAQWDQVAYESDLDDYLPLIGGTLTGGVTGTTANFSGAVGVSGALTVAGDATANLQVVPLQQLNTAIAAANPIPDFSATEIYVVGDFVMQGGHIWRAHAGNGPAAWSATNWHQVATLDDLDDYLPLTGGTLTGGVTGTTAVFSGAVGVNGPLTVAGNATANLQVVPLQQLNSTNPIPDFSASETYAVGDFVMRGGHIYRNTTAVTTPGAFVPGEWDQVAYASELETYLPLAGGTLTGGVTGTTLTLSGLLGGQAATFSSTVGVSGALTVAANATGPLQVVPLQQLESSIPFDIFSILETYAAGVIVVHNGRLYRATVTNGPGVWNVSNWTEVVLDDFLPLAGGTLTGGVTGTTLTLSGALTGAAATFSGAVGVSGALTVAGDATANLQVVPLQQLNNEIEAAGISEFSNTATYAVGDFVRQGGNIYRAVNVNGPGAFTAGDWTRVALLSDLTGFMTAVAVSAPITGNGVGTALGITPATTAQVKTGTDNVNPITSVRLREVIGDDVDELETTAKTVVPAINELHGDMATLGQQLAAVAGALRFVGNYDAATSQVTSAATGTLTVNSNLPAPATANEGWYTIVVAAGVAAGIPGPSAPNVQMQTGDWIVSNGTQWIHVPLYHVAVTAQNVAITTINSRAWTTVQGALQGIYDIATDALSQIEVDGVSIVGAGTTGAPFAVGTIDGGQF